MRSWKKRWKEELDNAIPSLREDVKQAAIDRSAAQTPVKKQSFFSSLFARKRLFASLSACACAALILCVSLVFALQPTAPAVGIRREVIALEINPKAAFVLDDEGKISSVLSMNADADVVLAENRHEQIEGKAAAEGIKAYVDYAARLGYLRLDKEDAVRISTSKKKGYLDGAAAVLTEYFRQKGAYIAVVKERLTDSALAERLEVNLTDGALAQMQTLYSQREAEAVNVQTAYKNVVIEGKLDEYGEERAAVQELYALNVQIKLHFLSSHGKGYWNLPDDRGEDEEFLSLVAEMEEKLADYELAYGKKLTSEEELNAALADVGRLLDLLGGLLTTVTDEFLQEVVGALEALGVDEEFLAELRNLPKTVAEFAEKAAARFSERYAALTARFSEVYEEARAEICEADYAAYIEGLEENYGSLSAYWEQFEK